MPPIAHLLLACGLVAVLAVPAPAIAADVAGKVSRIKGIAVASMEGENRLLEAGSDVFVGDTITTNASTRVEMSMIDEATITLGDHSYFVVSEYYGGDEGEGGEAVFEMLHGVLIGITGKIAKADPDAMTVETPVATIGIRGTTFWGAQSPTLLEVLFVEGTAVTIESEGGSVELTVPDTGASVTDRTAAPSDPKPWGAPRIEAARRSVAFE